MRKNVSRYRFGRFDLDAAARQLSCDGASIALGARAFDVLLALVERSERLVTKEELLQTAWPGLVVEENNLQVQISVLRKALGAGAIVTIPARGYRLAADVWPVDPQLPAPDAPRHNLPHPLTSFVGHAEDLVEYRAFLEQSRLLTITGIGGCGKTRLAIELARSLLPHFPDGVWFVDAAPLTDPERLPLSVAAALGIRTQTDKPHIDTLCDYLKTRRSLLVLDNCEHVSAACAGLVRRLLDAAPALRVLVTSREGLSVPGERAVTVRSLELPHGQGELDVASVRSCEAVRLFADRAAVVLGGFSVDESNAAAIAEICRRVDGIPLAIELAAARMKVLSPKELLARLHDRFRLLTGGQGTLGRQQTLLATIQWSYNHLSAHEQRLLRQLSVFAGGWSVRGAAQVCRGNADEYQMLDLLGRLADLSLIRVERSRDAATRYAMLETVRQYALDQLNQSAEGDAARTRHLEFFVALAEEIEPRLSGEAQSAALLEVKAEFENLLQALAWCAQAQDGPILGLRLVCALHSVWDHFGVMELGREATLAALARPGAHSRGATRAKALVVAGHLSCSVVRHDQANELVGEALSIAQELGDTKTTVGALRILAYVADQRGDSARALDFLQEALSLAHAMDDQTVLAKVLNGLGEVHRGMGHFEDAQSCYEEALALASEQRSTDAIASISDNLARVLIPRGEPERARDLVLQVLELSVHSGSKWTALCAFDISAALAALAGEWPNAARLRGAAEARVKVMKYRRDRTDDAFLEPWTAAIRAALGETAYTQAFDSGYALSAEQAVAEALAWLKAHPRFRLPDADHAPRSLDAETHPAAGEQDHRARPRQGARDEDQAARRGGGR